MLDWKVDVSSGWADIRADYGQCISFQQVDAYKPPAWPSQEVPQQMHLDVIVDDLDAAEAAVLELRQRWGLDEPLPAQFAQFVGRLARASVSWAGDRVAFRPWSG